MSFEKYKIKDHDFIVGLSWQTTTKSNIKLDIKSSADQLGNYYAIDYPTLNDDELQFSLADNELVLGNPSGGELLLTAEIDENLIYLCPLNSTSVWCCIIYNGSIVVGGDKIISLHDFQSEFNELTSQLSISHEQFNVYCDTKSNEDIKAFSNAELSIDDIYENIEIDKLSKFYALNEVAEKKPKKILHISAALIIAGLIGYNFYPEEEVIVDVQPVLNVDDMRKKLPQSRSRSIGDFVNQKIGPSRSQLLEDAYQEEIAWHNIDYNLIDESNLIKKITNFISESEINRGGWTLKQYVFDYSQASVHELLWEKTARGTALTLKQNIDNNTNGDLYFDERGLSASSFHPVGNLKPDIEKDIKVVMAKSDDNIISITHDLDRGHYIWFTNKREVDERPVEIEGISNVTEAKKRQFRYQSKSLRINGSGISQLSQLGIILSKHDRFMIERVVFDFDNNFKWLVYGVFYEHEQK